MKEKLHPMFCACSNAKDHNDCLCEHNGQYIIAPELILIDTVEGFGFELSAFGKDLVKRHDKLPDTKLEQNWGYDAYYKLSPAFAEMLKKRGYFD